MGAEMPKTEREYKRGQRARAVEALDRRRAFLRTLKITIRIEHAPNGNVIVHWIYNNATKRRVDAFAAAEGITVEELQRPFGHEILRNAAGIATLGRKRQGEDA